MYDENYKMMIKEINQELNNGETYHVHELKDST